MTNKEFEKYVLEHYAVGIPPEQAKRLFDVACEYSRLHHKSDKHKAGQCFMTLVSSYRKINNMNC